MKKKKHEMYYIEWDDHYSTDGWHSKDLKGFEPVSLSSVGFFLKEDKDYYHFARTIGEGDTCGDVMSILKNQTTKIKELK